jgi:glycosyltransferase involved in cell wall biosynthesis
MADLMKKSIVFIWDNFGPIHVDRAKAVALKFAKSREVVGVELNKKSDTYDWNPEADDSFKKITISDSSSNIKSNGFNFSDWLRLQRVLFRNIGSDYFFCHYERPTVFWSALILRLLGQKVYVMNDSKFDDYERQLWREVAKAIFYTPYSGGLASGVRARDYMRFLGVPKNRIMTNYNSMSLERIRRLANAPLAPNGIPHQDRHFTVVARLVEKKNLFKVLDAYAEYTKLACNPRRLKIAGSGPLEAQLRAYALKGGTTGTVDFLGFIQTSDVSKLLASTLTLLLMSTEEQFGNVVIEAVAMGVPCIVSTACGARDELVKTGVNGFIVEPDNARGAAFFMKLLSSDRTLWETMSTESVNISVRGDVSVFVEAISKLVES